MSNNFTTYIVAGLIGKKPKKVSGELHPGEDVTPLHG